MRLPTVCRFNLAFAHSSENARGSGSTLITRSEKSAPYNDVTPISDNFWENRHTRVVLVNPLSGGDMEQRTCTDQRHIILVALPLPMITGRVAASVQYNTYYPGGQQLEASVQRVSVHASFWPC